MSDAFMASILGDTPMQEIIDTCHTEVDRVLKR